jgi:diaminopimelate decarboxylase
MVKSQIFNYNQDGFLCWNGQDLRALSAKYDRPIYLYDLNFVKNRVQLYKKSLSTCGGTRQNIFYALKANHYSPILQIFKNEGVGIDVVSGGELELAMKEGFRPEQIIFSGVGKTAQEIKAAINAQIRQINVESSSELKRISSMTKDLNKSIEVVFRLNPDVDVKTHPYIATGFRDNKFGMNVESLPELIQIVSENELLKFKGFSIHIGSQLLELGDFAEALRKLKSIVAQASGLGLKIERLDLGGGLGIDYHSQNIQEESRLLQEYSALIKNEFGDFSGELQFEPGRWLVGHAGVLVAQVQYLKNNGFKDFVILDSGMNHLMRPTLYSAHHSIWPLKSRPTMKTYDFVGPICESGDFLAKARNCSQIQENDIVLIADVGAYGYTMSNSYNLHSLPQQSELPEFLRP